MKILIDNIAFYLQSSGGISVLWAEIIERLLNEKTVSLKFLEYGQAKNIFRVHLKINEKLILK